MDGYLTDTENTEIVKTLIGVLLKLVNLKSEMFIDVPVPSQEVRCKAYVC
jgi:hypothetical protein